MYVSVIGKIEAGSSKVEFRLPEKIWPSSVANLDSIRLTGSGIQLQMVNFTYCDDPTHADTHFPNPVSLPFPSASDTYQPTIRVKIPKPFKATHRRSTLYFVPNLDLTTDTSAYEERADAGQYLPPPRLHRSTSFADPAPRRRLKRDPNLADREVKYYAGFDKPFAMTSFVKPGTTSAQDFLIKAKSYQELRINSAFGFLNSVNLSFNYEKTLAAADHVSAAAPDTHAKIEKLKVSVTIPPSLHIGFSDSRIWQALGFDMTEFSVRVFKSPDRPIQFFGPSNATANPVTLTATHWITARALLNTQLRLMAIQRGVKVLGEPFKDTISLGATRLVSKVEGSTSVPADACVSDTSYALTIYQTILRNITQELGLRLNALSAEENKAEATITLKKFVDQASPNFSSQNFKLLILAGEGAGAALGISPSNPCLWFPVDGNWKSNAVATTANVCDGDETADDLTYSHQDRPPTPENDLASSPRPTTPLFTSTPVSSPPRLEEPSPNAGFSQPPVPTVGEKRKADSTHPGAPPKKTARVNSDEEEPESNLTGLEPGSESGGENLTRVEQLEHEKQEAVKELETTQRRQNESIQLLEEAKRREQQARAEEDQRRAEEQKKLTQLETEKRESLEQLEIIKKQQAELSEALKTLKHQTQTEKQQKNQELLLLDQAKREREEALRKLDEEAKRRDEERQRIRASEEAREQEKLKVLTEKQQDIEQQLQNALNQLRQSQLDRVKFLEESKALTDEKQRQLNELELIQLRNLQKQKQDQLDLLENRKRQLEKEHQELQAQAKQRLSEEANQILTEAKRQAEIEKQKILDLAAQQSAAEAKEKQRALEQERILREQEFLQLQELRDQLQQERVKLTQERQKLQNSEAQLTALENEREQKTREAALLREQLKRAQDAVVAAQLEKEAAVLESQQEKLKLEGTALHGVILQSTENVARSETAAHNLEEETRRLETSLDQPIPPGESLMDVDASADQQSPQTFGTPEGSFSNYGDENDDPNPSPQDPADLWDYVDIPNPIYPPTLSFEPAQHKPLGRCPLPLNFPLCFTLILLEGVNRDYCMERGFCSVLGTVIVSANGDKKIIENVCVLQAAEIERFTLDIVDEHLNSYSPTRTGYVKLDLKLYRLLKAR